MTANANWKWTCKSTVLLYRSDFIDDLRYYIEDCKLDGLRIIVLAKKRLAVSEACDQIAHYGEEMSSLLWKPKRTIRFSNIRNHKSSGKQILVIL